MIRRLIILLLIVGCEEVLESIKEGCTTATACNYDATATKDDGSCVSPQGCNEWCEGDTLSAQEFDCTDVCGGIATIDCMGVCNGNAKSAAYGACCNSNSIMSLPCGGFVCSYCCVNDSITSQNNTWYCSDFENIEKLEYIFYELAGKPIDYQSPIMVGWNNGMVTSLYFSGEQITMEVFINSEIIDIILSFSKLETLNIQNTNITLIYPSFIDSISTLESLSGLYFPSNKLSSLPSSICNLSGNIIINVDGNCLSEQYRYDCIDLWGTQNGCE